MNYGQAYYELVSKLQPLYDAQEAGAIAHEVLYDITELDKLQRLVDKDKELSSDQFEKWHRMSEELAKGKPLQYVLGYAWFMGKQYLVNEHVLIPRPETEELVDWITKESNSQFPIPISFLDIGTGSGCIPIALQLGLSEADITGCDISAAAIEVAKQNAARLDATVNFVRSNFLDTGEWQQFDSYDIIVSNPPYIPIAEMDTLHANVRNYEPAAALFVEGDALLFYRAIAEFGKTHLNKDGAIFCETHADYAIDTQAMFEQQGYTTELRKDMHGNYRMLKATANSST